MAGMQREFNINECINTWNPNFGFTREEQRTFFIQMNKLKREVLHVIPDDTEDSTNLNKIMRIVMCVSATPVRQKRKLRKRLVYTIYSIRPSVALGTPAVNIGSPSDDLSTDENVDISSELNELPSDPNNRLQPAAPLLNIKIQSHSYDDEPITEDESDVSMNTTHNYIKEGFTKTLGINCSYPHSPDTRLGEVISLSLSKTADSEDTNYQEIAILSAFNGKSVQVKDDLGGNVTGVIGTQDTSYLAYTWQNPTAKVEGRYMCQVNGFDRQGHPVTLSSTAVVQEKQLDLQVALDRIRALETNEKNLYQQLTDAKRQLNDVTNTLSQTTANLTSEILDWKTKHNTTQNQLNTCNVVKNTTQHQLESTKANLSLTLTNHNDLIHQYILSNASQSSSNYTYFNQHYYVVSKHLVNINITQFQKDCNDKQGYLVEFDNKAEWDWVVAFLKGFNYGSGLIMMGITDEHHVHNWTYMTHNDQLTFTYWYSGRPNGSGSCAYIDTDMTMRDYPCINSAQVMFMCEIPCGKNLPCK